MSTFYHYHIVITVNMPIISTASYLTTVTVCKPTAQSMVLPSSEFHKLVKRELLWSHSKVFFTPFGTLSTLEHPNVPDLTTVYTPDPTC